MILRTLFLIVTLLATCIAFGTEAGPTVDTERLVGERPNAGGPPETIEIVFALLDIDDIDDKNQRFSVDAYFEIRWLDPRLAVKTDARSNDHMRTFPVDEIWTPGLTIVNDRGLSAMLPQVASVDNDGNAVIRQRMSGRLGVNLSLHNFPFDTQQLTIDMVSYRHPPSELVFSDTTEFVADVSKFSADGWRYELLQPSFSIFRMRQDAVGKSKLTLAVVAHRKASFYVLTLALPMTLILFMAWTVHWLQPSVVPARMGMSTATVFSLIALGVSFRLSLPQIDYLTQADRFVMFSTLLVLLSLAVTVVATRWVNHERMSDAVRLTKITFWVFPLIFAIIIVRTLTV
jgi:hypothetical protein